MDDNGERSSLPDSHLERATSDLLAFLEKVLGRATALSGTLGYDASHAWHISLVGLYGTILELCDAAVHLLRAGKQSPVPILLRSAFEAHVDLKNLAADRCYGYHLRAADKNEWLRLLKLAKKGGNPFLKAFSDHPDLDSWISTLEADLCKLSAAGHGPLKIRARVQRAGLTDLYGSVYARLCAHSHGNLSALGDRHYRTTGEGEGVTVEYFSPKPLGTLASTIAHLTEIVMDSSKCIHRLLEPGDLPCFEQLSVEHRGLIAQLNTAHAGVSAPGVDAVAGLDDTASEEEACN